MGNSPSAPPVISGPCADSRSSGVRGAARSNSRRSPCPPAAEAGELSGAAVAAGDYDGDGFQDLVVGAPGENEVGGIWYLSGTSTGLTGTKSVGCTATSLGLTSAGFPALGEDLAQPH
nr:FG-GAP repeat protein [Streptomyces sp. NBC_00830]